MNPSIQFGHYWGQHAITTNKSQYWQLGPLHLWIEHLPHQWKVAWTHEKEWLGSQHRHESNFDSALIPEDAHRVTCVFGNLTHERLSFSPTLPNRPVVTRFANPLHVLPGEDLNVYVLSPLYLRVETIEPSKVIHEIPIFRLSDTWFGPVGHSGELCYSSTSPAFLDIRTVPVRLHSVISAVQIKNLGTDSLRLDKIKLPVPRLSLFYSTRTGFWTDRVTLERRDDSELATIKLDRQPPLEAAPSQFVTGPRSDSSSPKSVIRAFSAFFRDWSSL